MIDLTLAEVAAILRGRWLSPPSSDVLASGVGIDSRDDLSGRLFTAIRGARHDGHDFLDQAAASRAVAAVVERAAMGPASLPLLLVESTRTALADLARATRAAFTGRAAAVTGSCGKTTTRRLLASILDQTAPVVQSPKSFNNDLGVPLTLLALRPHHRALVAEIGTSAAGEIEPLSRLVCPHAAVITMIGHAHAEGLGGVEAIAREKASVVAGVEPQGTIVLPAECPHAAGAVEAALERLCRAGDVRCVTFGRRRGDARLLARDAAREGSVVTLGGPWGVLAIRLALPGEHNAMNALAAATAAHVLGAPPDAIRAGLTGVRPADMRFVRERIGPYTVFNDAYNANPEAMRASIAAFAEVECSAPRRVTLLGDMLELGEASESLHAELGRWLARAFDGQPASLSVFVGARSAAAARAFEGEAPGAEVLVLPDVSAESAARLREALRPGDSILVKASRGTALERLVAQLAPTGDAGEAAGAPAVPGAGRP